MKTMIDYIKEDFLDTLEKFSNLKGNIDVVLSRNIFTRYTVSGTIGNTPLKIAFVTSPDFEEGLSLGIQSGYVGNKQIKGFDTKIVKYVTGNRGQLALSQDSLVETLDWFATQIAYYYIK